jgi:PKD repeat protein
LHEDLTGWDNDWFAIYLTAEQTISIFVLYSKLNGILIPKLYNSTGSLLQFSYTNGQNERLNITVPSTGLYYLCIYAVQRCFNYDLFIFADPIKMDFSITTSDLTVSLTELVPLNVGIVEYNWNYGDGSQYSGLTANRTYTYTANGTYAVSLKIHLLGDSWYENPTKYITVNKTVGSENSTTPNIPSTPNPPTNPDPPSSNTDDPLQNLMKNQNMMIIVGCFFGGVVIIAILPKNRRKYLSDLKN